MLKVSEAELGLGEVQEGLARAEGRIDNLKKDKNKLRMHTLWADDHINRVVEAERESGLKENRVITDAAQVMVRKLASFNVPMDHVYSVKDVVVKGVGVPITDFLGPHSVGWIVLEGKVAGDIQLIHEMCMAKSKFVNLYVISDTNPTF